jgi:transcriptional regulator with XRE-family HTH domain
MAFGQNLQQAMKLRGDTAISLGAKAGVSNSSIGKYISGTRRPPKDVMRTTLEHYDEPDLTLAAMSEVTGGACVPVLDRVDKHPANTHLKAMEETREAIDALARIPITKRSDQLTSNDLKQIRHDILECVEAITALTIHVGVLCKAYCFSWIGIWREHRQDMKSKKYMN